MKLPTYIRSVRSLLIYSTNFFKYLMEYAKHEVIVFGGACINIQTKFVVH